MHEFGHHYCEPGYTVRPFNKRHYLFHYVYSGKGKLIATDDSRQTRVYKLGPGEGFMIWPNQVVTYIADESEPWQYAWIEFDGLLSKELVMKSGLDTSRPIYCAKGPKESRTVAEALLSIIENKNRPHLELMGRFYMFLSILIESSDKNDGALDANQQDVHILQKAIFYIGQNFQNEITVNEISEHCGVHRSYLYRTFKNALDTTPQQFLINYRIKRACDLLVTSALPISEISRLVGYLNPINFARAFKREVGQSPGQWRKASTGLIP